MTRSICFALAFAGCLVLTGPHPAVAEPTPTPAPEIALAPTDRTLNDLMAWRLDAARNRLENQEKNLAETSGYLAAAGFLEAAEGHHARALELLERAAAADPDDPAPEFLRGEVLARKGKAADGRPAWQSARQRAQKAVNSGGDQANPRAHFWLGASLTRLGRYADALEALQAAADGGFPPAQVHYFRGLAHVLDAKYPAAVDAFTEAEKADKRLAHLYFYRALAYNQLGKKDRMLKDMNQFVDLAPNAPEAAQAQAFLAAYGG